MIRSDKQHLFPEREGWGGWRGEVEGRGGRREGVREKESEEEKKKRKPRNL